MSLYKKICYKVENFFIKKMSKNEEELKKKYGKS